MNSQHIPKDFQPASSCPGLDYIDITTSATTADMRYSQNTSTTSLAIENSNHHSSPLINPFPPPVLQTSTPYSLNGGPFYHPGHHIYPALDVRHRLGSSNTSSTGMAHRNPAIPHSQQLSARDQYSSATPSFRRPSEHPSRSPSFPGPGPRRHPLSPSPSPIAGFTTPVDMDGSYSTRPPGQATIPPLDSISALGLLQYYADGTSGTPVRPEINGTIDKGFFLSDGEWTCYRRNYFSCVCSFSLSPHYPSTPLHFTEHSTQQTFTVQGFAMSISAVVADNDGHSIELVQHTPKRDKGPVMKPEKIRMIPKAPAGQHHPLNMYHDHGDGSLAGRGVYDSTYAGTTAASQGGGPFQMEHTFERIQFKQATANNGKRRAAQQYYHLVVELFADVGPPGPDQWVRVAYRRSAKMIVRGRSPGHYQSERRGSTSSGPGGGGSSGGYGNGSMLSTDFSTGGSMLGTSFAGGYETRGAAMPPYGSRHHHQHDLPTEVLITPEDAKAIDNTNGYQYYPSSIYEGLQDSRSAIAGFSHPRGDREPSGFESKGKTEYDGSNNPLPSIFHPNPMMVDRRCSGLEGKSRTEGYYPSLMGSQSGVNISSIT